MNLENLNKLTTEEVKILATLLNKLSDSKANIAEDQIVDTVTVQPTTINSPVKKKRNYSKQKIKIQVSERTPLTPTYEIQSPVKLRKEKELHKGTKVCPICGERFKPTNTRQKICSNELCKLIYKYDKAIEQHSALRMKELTEEFENRTKKTLIADNTTEINSMFLKDNPKVKTKVNGD